MANKKVVIYISNNLIQAVPVTIGKHPEIGDGIEMEWKSDLLTKAFQVIGEKMSIKHASILLSDDLVNLVEVETPPNITEEEERQIIIEKIRQLNPEALQKQEWDYIEKKSTKDGNTILAFAPLADFTHELNKSILTSGLTIDVIEPETISQIRHKDPIIGIALKDISYDEISQEVDKKPPSSLEDKVGSSSSEVNKKTNKKKFKIIIAVVIAILIALLIGGLIISGRAINEPTAPEPTPSTEIVISSPSPTPEPEIDKSVIKIEILNGSGVAGEAGYVKDILVGEKFDNFETGNADNYDYEDTIIQTKEVNSSAVYSLLKNALESEFTVTKADEYLSEDSEYDVVIIVGARVESE